MSKTQYDDDDDIPIGIASGKAAEKNPLDDDEDDYSYIEGNTGVFNDARTDNTLDNCKNLNCRVVDFKLQIWDRESNGGEKKWESIQFNVTAEILDGEHEGRKIFPKLTFMFNDKEFPNEYRREKAKIDGKMGLTKLFLMAFGYHDKKYPKPYTDPAKPIPEGDLKDALKYIKETIKPDLIGSDFTIGRVSRWEFKGKVGNTFTDFVPLGYKPPKD